MKKLIFLFTLLLTSCITEVIEPIPQPTIEKIFSLKESRVVDGQDIYFDLPSEGLYTLTLIDKESGQVISRERFNGKGGENIKNIYTKSIDSRYLYLVLNDNNKVELNRTTLILK